MNFIPCGKRSKKRALDRSRRGSRGAISPVARREADPRAYKRKKTRFSGGAACFPLRQMTKQSPFNRTVFLI